MESEQLASVVDRQVQFKAVKPAHGGFPPLGDFLEHLMAVDTTVMTNGDGSGVNKSHAHGLALALLEISTQGNQHRRDQGHKALIADSLGKSLFEMAPDIAQVIALEMTIVKLMEINDDRHDLTDQQSGGTPSLALSIG